MEQEGQSDKEVKDVTLPSATSAPASATKPPRQKMVPETEEFSFLVTKLSPYYDNVSRLT
jgi:hypothetical protein